MENKLAYIASFYGITNQTSQLDEEMAELTVETHKLMRGRTEDTKGLIEEIADVEILLSQLKILYEINSLEVDLIKEKKVNRQMERVNKLINC